MIRLKYYNNFKKYFKIEFNFSNLIENLGNFKIYDISNIINKINIDKDINSIILLQFLIKEIKYFNIFNMKKKLKILKTLT